MSKAEFISTVQAGYQHKGDSFVLGKAKFQDQIVTETAVNIPLKTLNRHGLIAGATGTGKTKTLQIICEQLSAKGIPSLVMDIKGDLSGLAQAGDATNPHIQERHKNLELPYEPTGFPVELLSLSNEKGVRLRATVTEFGPVLLSKILELNATQESIVSILFKFCDDHQLPLVDLDDLKKVMNYLRQTEEGKQLLKEEYGSLSSASMGAIQRKIVALEQQKADQFFGEPSFDVHDLLTTREGKGVVNILRLTDIQDRPKLFSTFMLSLLAEIYSTFPEAGDSDQPKLCLFIDEAHLVFKNASSALRSQIETVVKLIRSKGVGIFFITQVPGDVPEEVLSQLGLKVQHALRGFTAKDRKEIKKTVENYPVTSFYQPDELITSLGIGEAFVTVLSEKGTPTPLVHTHLVAPRSRMGILSAAEIEEVVLNSSLVGKYEVAINKESAYELLTKKMEKAPELSEEKKSSPRTRGRKKQEKSALQEVLGSSLARQVGRTLTREITRSLLGVLGIRKRR